MSNTQLTGGLDPGTPPGTGARVPTSVAPFAVQPGEGTALETPIGDVGTVKAAARQTNGSLTVLELVIGPEKGPALHTHLREDELWYVIDGDFRFKAAGEVPFCRWVMVVSCEKSAMAWNMLGPRMNRLGPL